MNFENPPESNFNVTAEKVETLNVGVKLLIWWTKSVNVNGNHIVQLSQSNVPGGNYSIKIDGTHILQKVSLREHIDLILKRKPLKYTLNG
jgi:hypothetical protein